jgi:N-hydroxyarylamine O-acetyltransferase
MMKMETSNFSLNSYLKRIDFQGKPEATIECVTALMRCQLCTVPFENLDVQAGKLVSIVPEDIVEKIINQRRGGYCYEINGLFSMALTVLKIPYRWVAARPMFYPMRRPKTHMAVVVELAGQQWLCDLGFGSYGITEPLALDRLDVEVLQGHDTFKLSKLENGDFLLQALVEGEWKNQFAFDLTPQEWVDFEPMNFMNSKHPEAVFVKSLLVISHQPRGRTILFGNSLKTIVDGQVRKAMLEPHEIDAVLKQTFQLTRPLV